VTIKCLLDGLRVSGGCLMGVCWMSGGCLVGIWQVSGGFFQCVVVHTYCIVYELYYCLYAVGTGMRLLL
jgi:hypothetical protein